MGGGYVLNFTDANFANFFEPFKVDIHSTKYQIDGSSKAKKLRAFWELESDPLVGRVSSDLLDLYEAYCDVNGRDRDATLLTKSREIVARLSGESFAAEEAAAEDFLEQAFKIPNLYELPVDFAVAEIIEERLEEARTCLSVGAYLSVIFLCGSVLEAVLLGAARNDPEKFNRSPASPKSDGKVKQFHEWSLAEFIDVATEVEVLKPDVKEFSHGLRHFRNYIHPYEQIVSGFTPDEYTSKVPAGLTGIASTDRPHFQTF